MLLRLKMGGWRLRRRATGISLGSSHPSNFRQRVAQQLRGVWAPKDNMPFKYTNAPVLVCNCALSEFPLIERYIRSADRTTVEGKFAVRFRARKALPEGIAREIISVYDTRRRTADSTDISRTYDESMPSPPTVVDRKRRVTYQGLVRNLRKAHGPMIQYTAGYKHCPEGVHAQRSRFSRGDFLWNRLG